MIFTSIFRRVVAERGGLAVAAVLAGGGPWACSSSTTVVGPSFTERVPLRSLFVTDGDGLRQ